MCRGGCSAALPREGARMTPPVARGWLVVLAALVIGVRAEDGSARGRRGPAISRLSAARRPRRPSRVPRRRRTPRPRLAPAAELATSRGANRDFSAAAEAAPDVLSGRDRSRVRAPGRAPVQDRGDRFAAAVAREARYVPAWIGLAEAQLGLNNDGQAIAALERVLAIDPKREAVRARLELVRFRHDPDADRRGTSREAGQPTATRRSRRSSRR